MVTPVIVQGGLNVTAKFDGVAIAINVAMQPPMNVMVTFGGGNSSFSGDYNDLDNKPTIPTSLSDLADDNLHRTVSDYEKNIWDSKSNFSGNYVDLSGLPNIPTKLSQLVADTENQRVSVTDKATYSGKQDAIVFTPEDSVVSFSSMVRATLLTGMAAFTNTTIIVGDTIITAFAKLQGQINSNKSRLSVLEDRVIAEIITTTDVEFVEFTLDNETNIEIQYSSMTGYDSDSILGFLYINGISTSSYVAASNRYVGMLTYGGRYSFAGTMRVLVNNEICSFYNFVQTIWGLAATPATKTISARLMTGYLEIPITAINTVRITAPFRAGLSIKIIRL